MTEHPSPLPDEEASSAQADADGDPNAHGWSAIAIVAAIAAVVAINKGSIPAGAERYAIPLALGAAAAVAAVRWWRLGVRAQARTHVARKIRDFGGGLYGTVAWATFVYLEVRDLQGEMVEAGGVAALLNLLSFGWIIEQMVQSVQFAVTAMMWPFHWFAAYPAKVAVGVMAGVWAFDGLAKLAVAVAQWLRARRQTAAGSSAAPWTPVHAGVAQSEEKP